MPQFMILQKAVDSGEYGVAVLSILMNGNYFNLMDSSGWLSTRLDNRER